MATESNDAERAALDIEAQIAVRDAEILLLKRRIETDEQLISDEEWLAKWYMLRATIRDLSHVVAELSKLSQALMIASEAQRHSVRRLKDERP